MGGADAGRAEGDAGVGVEATGEVDGEDGDVGALDGGGDGGEGVARWLGEAGAEDCVDDEQCMGALDRGGVGGGWRALLGSAP